MIHIELIADGWSRSGGTTARGYAHLDERFLRAETIAAELDGCTTDEHWAQMVSRLNGCFAVVTRREQSVLAAVDRIRSVPLFYRAHADSLLISDSAYTVLQASGAGSIIPIADAEFRLTGYVTGLETLFPGICQVQAGEHLRFDPARSNALERNQYYDFSHGDFTSAGISELISRLERVHVGVFRRLVDGSDGRTIAVPLSGGYDSRLIGVSLRDMGVRDVVCYSYGVPGNWESRISRELARYLGFRWEFVPYSAERWRALSATSRFRDYLHAAGNLCSVPHVQDWPAVDALQKEARVPPDSIFVPGHSGDFLAGSHIPKWFVDQPKISRRALLDSLLEAHYSLWDWPEERMLELRDQFDRRIESITGSISDCSPEQAADAFERWDLRERQAKFICNSVRVYESFGYDWRLPLFDHELMNFWSRIPVTLRVGRLLYFEFARQRQALPITRANTDHGALVSWIIRRIDGFGLRPASKRAARALRRLRWRHEYSGSPLAWFALVDRAHFGRTYTGAELVHSYMAVQYRNLLPPEGS